MTIGSFTPLASPTLNNAATNYDSLKTSTITSPTTPDTGNNGIRTSYVIVPSDPELNTRRETIALDVPMITETASMSQETKDNMYCVISNFIVKSVANGLLIKYFSDNTSSLAEHEIKEFWALSGSFIALHITSLVDLCTSKEIKNFINFVVHFLSTVVLILFIVFGIKMNSSTVQNVAFGILILSTAPNAINFLAKIFNKQNDNVDKRLLQLNGMIQFIFGSIELYEGIIKSNSYINIAGYLYIIIGLSAIVFGCNRK